MRPFGLIHIYFLKIRPQKVVFNKDSLFALITIINYLTLGERHLSKHLNN